MITFHIVPGIFKLDFPSGAVSAEDGVREDCTEEVSAEVVAVNLSAALISDSWSVVGWVPAVSLQALWQRLFKGD